MNRYQAAMNKCSLPDGFEERLHANILAEAGQVRTQKPYRPMTFICKAVLTVIIILMLTVTVSAAVITIPWDRIFINQFGSDETTAFVSKDAFQNVNVTSVCEDTSLTIRQTLGDTNTIYIILDMKLPESLPLATAFEEADSNKSVFIESPEIWYYATGDISWEEIQGKSYEEAQAKLSSFRFPGGSLSSLSEEGYDASTNTITYLLGFTTDSSTKSLTDQPLTLLIGGMRLVKNDTETTIFSGPFLITFQPTYSAKSETVPIVDKDGNKKGQIIISPFAFQAELRDCKYTSIDDFYRDIEFIYSDGTIRRPEATGGYGGGCSKPENSQLCTSVSIKFRFNNILDLDNMAGIQIGDYKAALK